MDVGHHPYIMWCNKHWGTNEQRLPLCRCRTVAKRSLDGDQQQVNTAGITVPATAAAARLRMAGKME